MTRDYSRLEDDHHAHERSQPIRRRIPEKATQLRNLFSAMVFVGALAAPVALMGVGLIGAVEVFNRLVMGGSGVVHSIFHSAENLIASILLLMGLAGLWVSIGLKATVRNEHMQHAAHMGITGSGIAIVTGLLADDIINLLQSVASGGGGG